MKNILLGVLLLVYSAQAQAQERFFKLINGWKNLKMIERETSYFSLGIDYYTNSHNVTQFDELSFYGSLFNNWQFEYDLCNATEPASISLDTTTTSPTWIIAGTVGFPNDSVTNRGTIGWYKYDLRDTIRTVMFNMGKQTFIQKVLPVSLNRYAVLSDFNDVNHVVKTKLLMIDSSGHIIWERTFSPTPSTSNHFLKAKEIELTSDGGYLITCHDAYYNINGDIQRPVLIKTNSQGVQQWRRYVGDANYLCEGGYAVATPDGGWLVAWSAPMTYAMVSQSNMQDGVRIEKIRANGSTEWVTNLGNYFEQVSRRATYYPTQFQALADGNYLVSGKTQGHGFLAKVDSNGNPLWYRLILDPLAAQNNVFYAGAMIYSATPTSDGGFICAGEYQSDPGGLFPNFVQSAFAMKLDEYGCLEPGCQLADAVEEAGEAPVATITVSPNPSTGLYYINQASDEPLLVYDINGQLLQYYAPHTTPIDLSHWAAGLYILSIGTDKQRLIKL